MDPMPDVGYVLTPDRPEEWRTIKGKWQKVEPVNGGRDAMATPEDFASELMSEIMEGTDNYQDIMARLIRSRDREVQLALLDELDEYATYRGSTWADGAFDFIKQRRAELQQDDGTDQK